MTFVDTSAAGRLLVRDRGSDEARDLFAGSDDLFGSTLLIAELLRLAARYRLPFSLAERVIRRISLLDLDDSLLSEAGHLVLVDALVRTADALHVVTAQRLGQTVFVTDDRRRAVVAEAVRLDVHAPGSRPGGGRSRSDRGGSEPPGHGAPPPPARGAAIASGVLAARPSSASEGSTKALKASAVVLPGTSTAEGGEHLQAQDLLVFGVVVVASVEGGEEVDPCLTRGVEGLCLEGRVGLLLGQLFGGRVARGGRHRCRPPRVHARHRTGRLPPTLHVGTDTVALETGQHRLLSLVLPTNRVASAGGAPGGEEVAAGALLVTSALATVEVARALRRLGVDDPGGATTTSALAGVAESPISDEVIALARRTGPSVLRSLDALHLATALLLDVDAFLTYDDRLGEAATSVGLAAAAPGTTRR